MLTHHTRWVESIGISLLPSLLVSWNSKEMHKVLQCQSPTLVCRQIIADETEQGRLDHWRYSRERRMSVWTRWGRENAALLYWLAPRDT